MSKPPSKLLSAFRSVLPNAAWDLIKNIGQFAYQNWALVVVIMGFIASGLTALINRLRGIPSDAVGILVLFGIVVLVALFSYVIGRVRDKKRTVTSGDSQGVSDGLLTTPDADTSTGQDSGLLCPYELVHRIADHQARAIRDFVTVSRVAVWEHKLQDPVPTIRWGFMIKNNSLFPVGLVEVRNNLFFEKVELAERRFEYSNEVEQLQYWREGSVVFEQRLSGPEAQYIKNTPDGKFRFNRLIIKVGNPNNYPIIEPQELEIGDDLETTLGRITYKETEGMKSLRQERNALESKLRAVSSPAPDDKNIAERKALIESWRMAVSKAVQQYRKGEYGNYTFQVALEHQEAYMTLIPKLSASAKTALDKDAGVSGLLEILANEITRIEQEWWL